MLSRPSQRYYGPLRLPGQPGGDFGVCLIPVGWTPVVHWPGSPVVPPGTILACHPCYPGGPRVTWQRWWSPGHRSSSSGNGVDALTEVHEATPGFAARYGLRGCARPSDALVRELGVSGYPSHLPQATRARCPLPEPDFHRRVPEYPRHATGHLQRGNCVISLEMVGNSSETRRQRDCRTSETGRGYLRKGAMIAIEGKSARSKARGEEPAPRHGERSWPTDLRLRRIGGVITAPLAPARPVVAAVSHVCTGARAPGQCFLTGECYQPT